MLYIGVITSVSYFTEILFIYLLPFLYLGFHNFYQSMVRVTYFFSCQFKSTVETLGNFSFLFFFLITWISIWFFSNNLYHLLIFSVWWDTVDKISFSFFVYDFLYYFECIYNGCFEVTIVKSNIWALSQAISIAAFFPYIWIILYFAL